MRISTKLTLGFSATTLVLFGGYAAWHVQAETRELYAALENETRLLTRSLQVSLENALRDEQQGDVDELVQRLELLDRSLDVFVYDASGRLLSSSGASAPPPWRVPSTPQAPDKDLLLRYEPADEPQQLVLGAPLVDDERLLGWLTLHRPLDPVHADLQATMQRAALSLLGVVATLAIIALLLGNLHFARPLAALEEAMRGIREGELSVTLDNPRNDEIGLLAKEFNRMAARLRETQSLLASEAEARRTLEQALQHADKLAAVGQLAAGLAHEIGSPLLVLSGRARALLERSDQPEEVRRNAELLVTQTKRITRIVEQLLHVGRRRAGSPGPSDVADAARTVASLLQIEARRHGVDIDLEVSPQAPPARATDDHLQQIALNLMKNALQATPRGGRITVRVEPAGARVRLEVRDTGPGIPDEVAEGLFSPFFTTRSTDGGTGLGLAVVRGLVEEHRGTVRVESEPGQGSRFIVELPAEPMPMEAS